MRLGASRARETGHATAAYITLSIRGERSHVRRRHIDNRDVCGCGGILNGVNDGLRIRPAGGEDADPIARLFIASRATLTFLPNIHTDEETFYFIANIVLRDQEVQVAETIGEISGFLAIHGEMVEHLYVRPDLLRRGIGSALLQRAKERLPSGFRLWVFQENVPARRFYERHGLRLVEETDGSRNEERTPDALYEWRPTDP